MTIPDQRQAPPAPPVPVTVIQAEKDSRLEQLLAQYDDAKAAEKDARDRFKTIADGIKAELYRLTEGNEKVDVHSNYLNQPLALRAQYQTRLDTDKLKTVHPDLCQQFSKQTAFWKLEARR